MRCAISVAALTVSLLLGGAPAVAAPSHNTSIYNPCSPPTPHLRCNVFGACYCSAYDREGTYRPCLSPRPYLSCVVAGPCRCSTVNPRLLRQRQIIIRK